MAWKEFRRGKRNKIDVQNFEFEVENNLFQLHEELKSKTYVHSHYTSFYITDPKLRHIHKATVRDRVLHHAVFRILYPLFDKSFIFDSYSCRNNKGTHRAVLKLDSFVRKPSQNYSKNIFALKCDISKYFDSIDQKFLMQLIDAKVKDKDTLWLINKIIKSIEKQPGKGIPLGNVTSQLFANIYLNELDQFMKHKLKTKYYLRYCDDFIILHKDIKYLEQLVPFIQLFLEEKLQLNLHPRKVIFTKLSQGIDFLGYVILPNHRILRTKTKKRMFKKLSRKQDLFRKGSMDEDSYNQTLQSYFGLLSHGDTHQIKKEVVKLYGSAITKNG